MEPHHTPLMKALASAIAFDKVQHLTKARNIIFKREEIAAMKQLYDELKEEQLQLNPII